MSLYGLVDSPLLHVAYTDDVVLLDGAPAIRSALLFSTAVTGEPVSVSVIYTRPGQGHLFTAALDRTNG